METDSPSIELKPKHPLFLVTPLSKYLALFLFILMPFLGGWIGYTYAPVKEVQVDRVIIKKDVSQNILQNEQIYQVPGPDYGVTMPNGFKLEKGAAIDGLTIDAFYPDMYPRQPQEAYTIYFSGQKRVTGTLEKNDYGSVILLSEPLFSQIDSMAEYTNMNPGISNFMLNAEPDFVKQIEEKYGYDTQFEFNIVRGKMVYGPNDPSLLGRSLQIELLE